MNTTEAARQDVIIVGGSYAGLAAAMALGRSMRDVVVIDAGKPCNRFTPHSHNFLTHDGRAPAEIASLARVQVLAYPTVRLHEATAMDMRIMADGFEIETDAGIVWSGRKVIIATGIIDELPVIPGMQECWGKSVLHCPYCHGYEVRGKRTAMIGQGDAGIEMAIIVSHWAPGLTMLTNAWDGLTDANMQRLAAAGIRVDPGRIVEIVHENGFVRSIRLSNGATLDVDVVYAKVPFSHHSDLAARVGCDLTRDGYIALDALGRTTVPGVYAAGDCASRIRTVANAVGSGTAVGMQVNKDLVLGHDAG